ncbi:hypothetical protein [Sediminibacillus massiliensis]|uniref:hypothetical protein n=1 Tax=Sediminibacillus massiliensis TaxID=1926277 RepID=UPI0015C332B1|nr:hypothetical protein [Sediminibacillus massiliensis]
MNYAVVIKELGIHEVSGVNYIAFAEGKTIFYGEEDKILLAINDDELNLFYLCDEGVEQ